MDEAGHDSLLQQGAKGVAPVVCKGNFGESHRGGLSTEEMDNKENFCKASENGLDMSATYKAMPPTRRTKKGGDCHLRKSLAWNKAFSTEEGVLDPLELSMLSGSATKSNVSLLNGVDGESSPLTGYSVSTRVSLYSKARQVSAFDDKKYGHAFSTSESSGHKDSVIHMVPQKATLSKGICRSIPRTPAASSQKRLAYVNTSNPASKLPRFTATRSQTSSFFPNSRCSDQTMGHSIQNAKPANIEHNAGPKGSILTPIKAIKYSNLSSRSSAHKGQTFNETSELRPSADIQTLEMGKSISHLRTLQSQLPPNRLSASVGSSIFGKVEHSFSQNAQHFQGRCPPNEGQGKPSFLRMPTPSLGFFGQAKIPPHDLQSQVSKIFGASSEHKSQSLRTSHRLKHTDDNKTLDASHGWGQPSGSEPAGTKACAISTTFSSKNAGYSGNLIVASVTNSTLNKDIDEVASKRKMLKSATKPQVAACSRENDKAMHSFCLVGEDMEKQTSTQGSGCEPESPKHLASLADNSLLPEGRKFAHTLKQKDDFGDAGGIYVASENSGNDIMQNCSPMQLQQGDCGIVESLTCKQWEESHETSVSAGNECSLGGKHDSFSCLSFENNDKVVDRSPLLEIETSFSYNKSPLAGSTSTLRFHSSSEKLVPVVEGECRAHAVHGLGQCGLNHDTILLEEAHDAKKIDHQDCEVSVLRKENELASQDKSEAITDKQEAMEKPEKVPILLNQLKATPFSDEWVAAMESFGHSPDKDWCSTKLSTRQTISRSGSMVTGEAEKSGYWSIRLYEIW